MMPEQSSRDEQIRDSIISGQGVPNENVLLPSYWGLPTDTGGVTNTIKSSTNRNSNMHKHLSDSRRGNRTRGNRWDIMLAEQQADAAEDSIYAVNQITREEEPPKRSLWGMICVGLVFAAVLIGTVEVFGGLSSSTSSNNDPAEAKELGLPFAIPHSTHDAIKEEDSPHSAAYQWLMADPKFETHSPERLRQRLALAIFYFSTDGQEWTKKEGTSTVVTGSTISFQPWLSYDESECWWYSNSKVEEDKSVACDEEGNMLHLVIIENNLQGTLPQEISWLTSLKTLDLGGNSIGGTVPTTLGSLSNLEILSLFHNKFSNTIPSELVGLAPSLKWLYLRENEFTGTFPSEIWKLSNLEILDLSDNEHLVGSLPHDLGTLLPNLQDLRTSKSSQWGGSLPTSIAKMTKLKELHLHHNQMTGSIPWDLPDSLEAFKAPRNQFSGYLPIKLPPRLEHLELGGNKKLEGTIPPEWNSTTLVELKLWGTSLTGTVPDQLCKTFVLEFDCSDALCGCDCACEDFAG